MELLIERKEFYEDCVIGGFYIDGEFAYFTLEDTDRYLESGNAKIPKETAIPRGKYRVTISYSNRFQKMMPQILDVPQFTGIRIHAGNVVTDTEGCVLIGMKHDAPNHNILKSVDAFNDFFPRLTKGLTEREVWIEIT
jgi:hypothetical protein